MSESVDRLIEMMAQALQNINPDVDPFALLAASLSVVQRSDSASIEAVFATARDLAVHLR